MSVPGVEIGLSSGPKLYQGGNQNNANANAVTFNNGRRNDSFNVAYNALVTAAVLSVAFFVYKKVKK